VERLVSGQMDAADAPPGFRLVAGLLQEAGTIPAGPNSAVDESTVSAMVAAIAASAAEGTPAGSPGRRGSRRLVKVFAAATFATLASGGVAAASGDLPDPIQDVVSNAAGIVGVDIPRGNAYGHLDKAEKDAVKEADKADRAEGRGEKPSPDSAPSEQENNGQGAEISDIAKDPALEGVDKGACVSGAASDGKSRAGEQAEATCDSGDGEGSQTPGAPEEVPSGGVDPAGQGAKPEETPAGPGHGGSVANDKSNGASQAKADNGGAPEELPQGGRR
jgi:hypothetical protein